MIRASKKLGGCIAQAVPYGGSIKGFLSKWKPILALRHEKEIE